MISVSSVLLSLLLCSELSGRLVTVALPAVKLDDGVSEPDGPGRMLSDEPMAEVAAVPPMYRRSLVLDDNVRDEDGSPKVIIIPDARLRGHGARGLNPVFSRSLPLLSDRTSSRTPAELSLKVDRRDTDFDMLRCMIGRVYRPCWEA